MAFTMQLTDSTTTISFRNFISNADGYYLQGESYTPQINRRNSTGFGDTFLPVDESFLITVIGTGANNVLAKIADLVELLDNVQLWQDSDGAAADAVNFVFKPGGSTAVDTYRAIVLEASVNYPDTLEYIGNWVRLPNVRINLTRGVWLGAAEVASSAAAVQPSVLTATFGSAAAVASPVDTLFSLTGIVNNIDYEIKTILSNRLFLFEAESGTITGAAGSVVAVATASAGSVYKHTPSGAGATSTTLSITSAFPLHFTDRNYTVYATLRNEYSGAAIDYTLTTSLLMDESRLSNQTIIIGGSAAADSYPRIVNLGSFFFSIESPSITGSSIEIVINAPIGAGGLYIDTVVLAAINDDESGSFDVYHTLGSSIIKYQADGNALTRINGIVKETITSAPIPVTYSGQARLYNLGTSVSMVSLAVSQSATGWRLLTAAGADITATLTATRRLASLTPK